MSETTAVRIHETGGPEALRWEKIQLPPPSPGEVVIRHEAVGLNFIDTYLRSGLYPLGALPAVLGTEGAGVIEELGENTAGMPSFEVGDRVAYGGVLGAYSERRIIAADRLVHLPPKVSAATAAVAVMKGMTAWYLCRRTYRVKPKEAVLVHAAAGGVGSILAQWCRLLGATVIGTAGSQSKAAFARRHGCHHVILYKDEDFVEKVRDLTQGAGVPVVFDGVGKDTFDGSLECLSRFGRLVTFGNASGLVPPFDLLRLSAKGLTIARPSLLPYIEARADLEEATGELFRHIEEGRIKLYTGQRFALKDVTRAHRALESRATEGCTLLLP